MDHDAQPPKTYADPEYAILRAEAGARALQILVHEISNLVDGSMRSLSLAVRHLDARTCEGSEDLTEPLRHLETTTCGLAHMTDLLQSLSRPAGGGPDLRSLYMLDRPQPVDESIEHAIRLLSGRADEQSITIHAEVDESLRNIPPCPIHGVVLNVIQNAIEAIGEDGTVWVRARVLDADHDNNARVLIEIIDDGPGPPEGLERDVFEFGFTTKHRGLGLGLALVRDTICGLGGSVSLENAPRDLVEAGGSRLVIVFPVPARIDVDAAFSSEEVE